MDTPAIQHTDRVMDTPVIRHTVRVMDMPVIHPMPPPMVILPALTIKRVLLIKL